MGANAPPAAIDDDLSGGGMPQERPRGKHTGKPDYAAQPLRVGERGYYA